MMSPRFCTVAVAGPSSVPVRRVNVSISFVSRSTSSIAVAIRSVSSSDVPAGKKKSITFPVKASKERGFYLTGSFKLSRKELGMTSNPPQGKLDDEISVTVTVGVDPNAKTD